MPTVDPRQGPRAGGDPRKTLNVGFVILIGALLGCIPLYRSWKQADVSGAWPTAPGKIESSSLTMTEHIGAHGGKAWTVNLVYSYTVDGTPYRGSTIHFGGFPSYAHEDEARAKAGQRAA
jgi:hypothetical protein